MAATELTPEEIKKQKRRVVVARSVAKWRKAHPEENRERQKKWHEDNPDWKTAHNARYRAGNAEAIRKQREGRKEEISAVSRKWYEANQEAQRAYALQYSRAHPEQHAENYKRFAAIPSNRMRMAVSDAGTRAKKRGLEFDGLDEIAASFPTDCPCCQATLDYTKTVFNLSPSLDRRDNSRGYTLDNVRVICRRCNSLKRDASIQDLENILAYMRRG